MPPVRSSPRERPPAALRALTGLLGLGAVGSTLALMMSDRAPGLLRRIFGAAAERLSARLDASGRAAAIAADPRLPESDAIVHVALWAVAMLLIGLTVWSWVGVVSAAAAVFALGVVIELAQGRATETRAVELSDVAANGAGVALGVLATAACYLAWSALTRIARPARRR